MKLRNLLLLVSLSGLVTAPALAAVHTYDSGADLIITSPTALNGCSVFFAGNAQRGTVGSVDPASNCEIGVSPWGVGAGSTLVIDTGATEGTDLPEITNLVTQSALTQQFSCGTTSNANAPGAAAVPGCRVYIETDTYNNGVFNGTITANSIVADNSVYPGGYAVDFVQIANVVDYNLGGLGTYCDAWCDPVANGGSCSQADNELLEGGGAYVPYCQRVLGYSEEAWVQANGLQNFIDPLPQPLWYFSSDFNEYTVTASTAIGDYQIFSNAIFGNAIRGNIVRVNGLDSAAFPKDVPLAPLAALGALGSSLAYMGYTALRRRK
jgi:hypothetical protein